jgi:2-keto-4-pentenoate hydratase
MASVAAGDRRPCRDRAEDLEHVSSRVAALADALCSAHRQGTQLRLPADLTLEEAYRLQEEVFESLSGGNRPLAWKVGGPSDKVEPIMAPILPGALHASPARLRAGGFNMIAVECEIAFRLSDAGEAAEALVAIEVCDTRLSDWKDASAMAKLADFQSNAALVTGSGTPRWREIDFRAQKAELWIDGRKVREVTGTHSYGDPSRLLPWVAAQRALRAGDVITTGTWTGMDFVRPGNEVRAVFPGIGEAILILEA